MADTDIRPFRQPNTAILTAIRNDASSDYQRRIPDPTKASLQAQLRELDKYKPHWNEFVDALVNQIGSIVVRNRVWNNKLAKFKTGRLDSGDTVEEVQIGLIDAKIWNSDRDYLEKDIFGQYRPDVQSSFHRINRQNYYPITINENLLRRAFVQEYGLSEFIVGLMNAPVTSDNWDEYLLMTQSLAEYEKLDGFFKVNVPDIGSEASTEADAKFALRRMREMAGTLPFLSTHYNAAHMPTFANEDELELIITPEALAAIDVEALAGAFNIDKADMIGRTTVVPGKDIGIPGVVAIMTVSWFWQVYDTLIENTSQYNPVGLTQNYFLHHQGIISLSRFAPAVLFWTGEGTVIEDNPTPVTDITVAGFRDSDGNVVTEVQRGSLYSLDADAVTTPAGGDNSAVRFELIGGPYSDHTAIAQTSMLVVGWDEPATNISVGIYAVDTDIPQLTKTITATVVGDKVELWPTPGIVPDSDGDGLLEVTPKPVPAAPTSGANKNKVTIPNPGEGYDYKDGATVVNGQTITLTADKTITAVAQTGYEFATGATTSWDLVFTA